MSSFYSRSLHHLSVLVTRPLPAGKALCMIIEQKGGEAIHLPTINIVPPDNQLAFENAIVALEENDWLIFISPQAVLSSLSSIKNIWPQFPNSVKLAAIGAGTVKALADAGYGVAAYPPKDWSSEGLLQMPEFQNVMKKKIAIIKGEGGRDELEKTLNARGAEVSTLLAYRRALPVIDVDPYHELFKNHKIRVIVCTSGEGLQNLKTLFMNRDWPFIKNIPIIVISERMKRLAHDLDFQTIWLARNASHEAIIDTLEKRRNDLCQIKQMKS